MNNESFFKATAIIFSFYCEVSEYPNITERLRKQRDFFEGCFTCCATKNNLSMIISIGSKMRQKKSKSTIRMKINWYCEVALRQGFLTGGKFTLWGKLTVWQTEANFNFQLRTTSKPTFVLL